MELWADFDNKQDVSTNTVRQGRARHLTEAGVLSAVRDWLLHDYVAAYCRSLAATRIFRRCYWIDALATGSRTQAAAEEPGPLESGRSQAQPGKGHKKDVGQLVHPLLQPVISLSQALERESKPITLHGLILEAGSSKRREARAIQNGAGAPAKNVAIPKASGIVHASWLEAAPALLQVIDQSAAIFLLNPFGKTIFSYDDLAPLYTRTAPTELCLLISHKQLQADLIPSLRTPVGASAFTALLRNDRWKKLLVHAEDTGRTIEGLIDVLLAAMQQHFLTVQRLALPMQVRPAVVGLAPYTLIFATRRQDSLASMNDAVCSYRRRMHEQSHRGVLMEDWFAAQQRERFEEEFQSLCQRVLQQGRVLRTRRWPELRQQLLIANFGQFALYDYDESIYRLLLGGEVRCEWRQRPLEHTGNGERRIPGNDDTLLWK